METGYIIALLSFLGGFLMVTAMRRRRKAWEEKERQRVQREKDDAELHKHIADQLVATMLLPSIAAMQKAHAQALAADYANRTGQAAAHRQADLNRYQGESNAYAAQTLRPEALARISAQQDEEIAQQRRRRHDSAVLDAMLDATNNGLGVVRMHYDGADIHMEHVPVAEFKGGGGSFDGGGASGDYARSDCQTSSPASTSDTSSSCSSSDSGGSSSSD